MRKARLAFFLSGSGRTLENICNAIDNKTLSAELAFVLSSTERRGIKIAREKKIPSICYHYDVPIELMQRIEAVYNIDFFILGGYLKKLKIPNYLRKRVLNIHPSLLPKYGGKGQYGLNVHRAVIKNREKESGCTVHFCNNQYDEGERLAQMKCPVWDSDTPESLAKRVFELESALYPAIIQEQIFLQASRHGFRA